MHKDYEAYASAVNAALATEQEAVRAAEEAYNIDRDHILDDARHRAARATRHLAEMEARQVLKTSSDPLVAFVAGAPLADYPDHARKILEALPATMEELEAIARQGDWCSEWSKFVDAAAEAGVLPGQPPISAELRAVREYIRTNWSPSRARMVALNGLLDAALATAKAEGYKAAQDECEAAKADEAARALAAAVADTEAPDHEAPAE